MIITKNILSVGKQRVISKKTMSCEEENDEIASITHRFSTFEIPVWKYLLKNSCHPEPNDVSILVAGV